MKVLQGIILFLLALNATAGDVVKGREIVLSRGDGNCLLCHAVPGADRAAGNIGPSLAGVGARLSKDGIRERIADAGRFNAKTIMPPYGRTGGLHGVAPQYRGKPLLTPEQIDDAAEFLATLK
ncbi:MAG TPA: sulfur oxidation c-type cytochrome SoxX [Burkholderiales bacterium]